MLRRWIPGLIAVAVVLLAVESASAQRLFQRMRARRETRNETQTVQTVQSQTVQSQPVVQQTQPATSEPAETVTRYERRGLFGRRSVPVVETVSRSSPSAQQPTQQPIQQAAATTTSQQPATVSQGTTTYYERRGLFGRRRVPVQSSASNSPASSSEPGVRRSYYLEPNSSSVLLNVTVPANAEVLIDGQRTNQTGAVRQFRSPPLAPGYEYTYTVEARWQENGQQQTSTRKVVVQPGKEVAVDLTQPGSQ